MAYTPQQGTLLQVSISSTYTTIAQRTQVEAPEQTREDIKTTDLDSTDHTYIPGYVSENGEVKLKCWYDPAANTHDYLRTSRNSRTTEDWKLIFADSGAGTDSFSGYVKSLKKGTADVDSGLMELMVTIKVTGAISWST